MDIILPFVTLFLISAFVVWGASYCNRNIK